MDEGFGYVIKREKNDREAQISDIRQKKTDREQKNGLKGLSKLILL